jgi:hypothetical protein
MPVFIKNGELNQYILKSYFLIVTLQIYIVLKGIVASYLLGSIIIFQYKNIYIQMMLKSYHPTNLNANRIRKYSVYT